MIIQRLGDRTTLALRYLLERSCGIDHRLYAFDERLGAQIDLVLQVEPGTAGIDALGNEAAVRRRRLVPADDPVTDLDPVIPGPRDPTWPRDAVLVWIDLTAGEFLAQVTAAVVLRQGAVSQRKFVSVMVKIMRASIVGFLPEPLLSAYS